MIDKEQYLEHLHKKISYCNHNLHTEVKGKKKEYWYGTLNMLLWETNLLTGKTKKCVKKRYNTKKEAKSYGKIYHQRAYYCQLCKGHHLTSKTKKGELIMKSNNEK